MKEANKFLNTKKKRSKKASLECSLRLTGHPDYQPRNRFTKELVEKELILSDQTDKRKVPLRTSYRRIETVKQAIGDDEGNLNTSHNFK